MSDYLDQIEARVKPSRENLLDVVREAIADSWSDTEEYAEAPDYVTDAVLALLPGRTEQEIREEIAEQIQGARGIATPEQRMAWEREAEEIIAAHDADVVARCDRTVESAREQFANLGMTPGQIEIALGWAVRLAAVGHPHATEAVNVLMQILSTNRITRTDLYMLDHRVGISLEPIRSPRPAYCCGVCPQTMTGWDCTCPGNPRCTKETK